MTHVRTPPNDSKWSYDLLDCIGQPMFEWRWAFRVTSGQKDQDDKKIVAADPSKIFKGDEWGLGIR